MKINSVQLDTSLKQGGFALHSEANDFREKKSAHMYEKGYKAQYSGSFTGNKSKAATSVIKKSFGDKILTSDWFNWLLSTAEAHNVATSALIALGLAGVLRPATTMALPGEKDKEDKIYASGHAIASAIMGFGVSVILTSPLDDAFTKTFEASEKVVHPEKLKPGETLEQMKARSSKVLVKMFEKIKEVKDMGEAALKENKDEAKFLTKKKDAMKTLVKTMPDWFIAVPRSILTIALIPPILKYVFGLEKKKKTAQSEPQVADNNIMETQKMDFIEKPAFQAFKGGVK